MRLLPQSRGARAGTGAIVPSGGDRACADTSALAGLRDLVERHLPLPAATGVLDAEVLKHVTWLLETERLVVVECIEVRRELPDVDRAPAPPIPPPRRRPAPVEDVKTWIGIELLEETTGKPIANARYIVKGPSGTFDGTLDAKGQAKIADIDPGSYDISFPDIDGREWKAS